MKHLALLLLSSMAFGQGVILPTQQALKTVNGVTSPLPNATITVCAANASGIPCTPVLASAIFKDAALTQPLTNPFTSDANGNYVFAIAPGNYTVTVTGLGFAGYSYQTTAPVAAGANNTFTGATNLNGGGNLAGTFSGAPTFSGAVNFTSAKPAITVTSEFVGTTNAIRWVGNSPLFTTVEAAQADCLNDSTITGCMIWIASGFQETFTSTIVLGTSTKSVVLWGQPGARLTCNVSAGADCWQVHSTSGFQGHNVGQLGSPTRQSGFVLDTAATANIGNFIITSWCSNLTSEGAYLKMDNVFIQFTAGATMTTGLNLCNLNNQPAISNVFINGGTTNTTQILMQPGGSAGPGVLGPMVLTNVFSDCEYASGCHPAKITTGVSPKDFSVISVSWNGGFINHPGSGLPNLEINGNGSTNHPIQGIALNGLYLENALNGASIGIKLVDVFNVTGIGIKLLMQDTDTCIDISQSGAARTGSIHFGPTTCQSPTQTVVDIANHISPALGIAAGPLNLTGYNFGSDGSFTLGPFTLDANNLNIVSGSANVCGSTSGCVGQKADATATVWDLGPTSNGTIQAYFRSATGEFSLNRNPSSGTVNNSSFVAGSFDLTATNLEANLFATNGVSQGVLTFPNPGTGINQTIARVVASGTATMSTAAITAPACGTTVTVAATNVATTDTITWAFNAAPAGTNAGIVAWPTSGNVNFAYCPGVTETPAAATINWRVVR